MKKYVALILALVLCLSLCSCSGTGSTAGTKEKFLADATECNLYSLYKTYNENSIRAEENYCGKIVKITGYVVSIQNEYATIKPVNNPIIKDDWWGYNTAIEMQVYFSRDDLILLSNESVINFVGKIDTLESAGDAVKVTMKEAYYVDDTFELTGTVTFARQSDFYKIMFIEDDGEYSGEAVRFSLGEYSIYEEQTFGEFTYFTTLCGIDIHEGDIVKIQGKLKCVYDGENNVYGTVIGWKNKYEIEEISAVEILQSENSNENGDTIDTTTNPLTFRTITLDDEATANNILELWRAGEATDASMKEIMDEYGADQGGGLLYELDNPENYIQEIASWCLDNSRSAGDATVIKTEYGYAVVYIVSIGNS